MKYSLIFVAHNACGIFETFFFHFLYAFFFFTSISVSSKEKKDKQIKKNPQSHIPIKLVEAYSTLFVL